MRDHRKLRAFELADKLALEIYLHTKQFPREEQFGLTSQMRRAAVSVASNIVEGCARQSEGDFLPYRFVRELEYQLSLASRLGYLQTSDYESLASQAEETGKVLHGLIRSLRP